MRNPLPSRHQKNCGSAIRNLACISSGRRIPLLRECDFDSFSLVVPYIFVRVFTTGTDSEEHLSGVHNFLVNSLVMLK